MNTPSAPTPIERFLGPDEAAGGPFALLGLPARDCDDGAVLGALDRQLDRVAHHIECDTPEADEVRLALHAAAAQLLDPGVRRHLIRRWARDAAPAPRPSAPAQRPSPAGEPASAPARPPRSQAELMLEHDAILTLGLLGGWNARSLRRLVALAHARGLASSQVATALRSLASRRRSRPVRRAALARGPSQSPSQRGAGAPAAAPVSRVRPRGPSPHSPLPEQIDPAARLVRQALLFGGLGLLAVGIAIAVLVRVLTADPAAPTPTPAPPAPAPTGPGTNSTPANPAAPVDPVPPPSQPRPTRTARAPDAPLDAAAVARELTACVDGLSVDPLAATERFERAMAIIARGWGLAPRDRLVAAHDAIVEFIYRAGDSPETGRRALSAVGAGATVLAGPGGGLDADRVWPAVWSLGMLVRLSRERDLSIAIRDDVEARVAAAIGHDHPGLERTFEAGAGAALAAFPRLLTPPASEGAPAALPAPAWTRWAEAVQALYMSEDGARDAVLLAGLQTVLLQAADPGTDRSVLDVIGELVVRVSWRDGAEARRALLRWFDDRRISTSDLQAVTAALATRSGAEGVDLTMVLSAAAADGVRADLRERFAKLWSIELTVDRGVLAQQWAEAARGAVERSYAATGEAEQLAAAVVLSRLSESAWRMWSGDTAESARLLDTASADADSALVRNDSPRSLDEGGGDGAWAERYLASRRNTAVRQEQLGRLSTRSGIGPVDAEVLVAEALAGTPIEVRQRAAEITRMFVDSPAIINALLEQIPRAPRVVQTAQLVQALVGRRLPMVRDPAFPAAARRALVERLLELTAPEGQLGTVDRLSALLAGSYRGQASETPLPDGQQGSSVQPPAHLSAESVRRRWRQAVAGISPMQRAAGAPTLDQLERTHAARLGVARGMVQAFAAQQVAIAELMAVVVGSESPTAAEATRIVLAELTQKRRGARHVLEQVNAAERAIVQLWLARMPAEGSP